MEHRISWDTDLSDVIYYRLEDDTIHIGTLNYPIRTIEQRRALMCKLEVIGYIAPNVAITALRTLEFAHEMISRSDAAREIIKMMP
jgi:hypothetical protein